MSGNYPTSPEFSAINFKSIHKNVSSESRSGRLQVRSIGYQRWSFTAKYRGLTRAQTQPLYAFIERQRGMLETFTIVLPLISYANGNVSGIARVSGSFAAGEDSPTVTGFSGTIKAGDFIKFASHSKIYMVTSDRTGTGAIAIEPPLIAPITSSAILYDAVPFNVRMSNDMQKFSAKGGDEYSVEIDMLEEIV
jgi:hypothetical protein